MNVSAPPRAEWSRLALLFACNVLFAAGLFSHAFLYNFYLDRLGAGEALMGGAAAALTAGGLVGLVPAGLLVDRVGAHRAWLVAAALAAAGLAAGAFARTPLPIYGAAFLAGAGTSTWRVATGPLLMRLTTERSRERAFSWNVALLLGFGAVWTAAAGAAPGWLERSLGLGAIGGLRAGLFFGALGTLISGGLFAMLPATSSVAPVDQASTSETVAPVQNVATAGGDSGSGLSLALLGLILVVAIWMVAGGMVIPFLNLFFMREFGWEVARIGLLFGAAQAVTALVVAGSGDLAARLGARRMLLLWAVPFAPLVWGLSLAVSPSLAIALFLLQGFVPPATNPLIDQLLLERAPPGRQGAISTGRNAATEIAGLIGASAGGALLQASGFGTLFGAAGAVAVVGGIGLFLGFRPGGADAGQLTGGA